MNENYRVFYPDKRRIGYVVLIGTLIALVVALVALTIAFFKDSIPNGAGIITITEIIAGIAVLLIASVLVIRVLIALPSMRYELRDDALYLIVGPWKDRIPYESIKDVSVEYLVINPLSSFRMPGVALFNVYYLNEGTVRMYSTHASKDVMLIKTQNKKYGVSPENPEEFIAALQNKIKQHKASYNISTEPKTANKNNYAEKRSGSEIISWIIVAVFFALGIYFYPRMPARIAVHWSSSGAANGYLPKLIGMFFTPLLFALFNLLPLAFLKDSPLEYRAKFKSRYYNVMLVILGIGLFAYAYQILYNAGIKMSFYNFNTILTAGIVISIIAEIILFRRGNTFKE